MAAGMAVVLRVDTRLEELAGTVSRVVALMVAKAAVAVLAARRARAGCIVGYCPGKVGMRHPHSSRMGTAHSGRSSTDPCQWDSVAASVRPRP